MSVARGCEDTQVADGAAGFRFRARRGQPEALLTLAQRDMILMAWPPEQRKWAARAADPSP
jgi:hypothetical protein